MNARRTTLVGVALVIFGATVWLFWPSVHGEFLYGDDLDELQEAVRLHGLTWNAVKWSFTATEPDYYPLQRLTHFLDYQIWGKNAAGHHATSIVLHALNAALVFGFLWTLLGAVALTVGERLAMALGVAIVFAIHPLQTEPVAWMSCRTHLLSTTFRIGCLWVYVAGARRWVVWLLFTGALMCSPIAVSLPFVMLALDYFPLRRYERFGWGRLVREKAVLIGLGGVMAAVTLITESRKGGAMLPLETVMLSQRVLLMFQSLAFYAWKLVWPTHLSPCYPLREGLSLDQLPVLLSVLCVGGITVLAVGEWRRLPALVAGWGAYVVQVLPVSGLMQRGLAAVALRYAYAAILPLLLVVGGAVVWAWRRSKKVARVALVGFLGCALWSFGLCTRNLIPDWRNDETEYRAVLVEFPDSEVMNRAFAMMLLDQGRVGEALPYAQRDVEIAPELCYSHTTLGLVLGRLGRLQEAAVQNEQALRMNPDSAEAHHNFGVAMMELGKVPEAAEHFVQALRINPDTPLGHDSLGRALYQMGRAQEAIQEFEAELRIHPDYAEGQYHLSLALIMAGKEREAIAHFEQAVQLQPDLAEAHYNLGTALAQEGKIEEAIAHFEQTLRIKPDYAEAHNNLGNALDQAGRVPEAIVHYEQALRIMPDYAEAHFNLGNVLLREGKVSDAIRHYEEALRNKPDDTQAHCALGMALEQLGRTPEAIQHYEQALRLKPDLTQAQNALARLQPRQ